MTNATIFLSASCLVGGDNHYFWNDLWRGSRRLSPVVRPRGREKGSPKRSKRERLTGDTVGLTNLSTNCTTLSSTQLQCSSLVDFTVLLLAKLANNPADWCQCADISLFSPSFFPPVAKQPYITTSPHTVSTTLSAIELVNVGNLIGQSIVEQTPTAAVFWWCNCLSIIIPPSDCWLIYAFCLLAGWLSHSSHCNKSPSTNIIDAFVASKYLPLPLFNNNYNPQDVHLIIACLT